MNSRHASIFACALIAAFLVPVCFAQEPEQTQPPQSPPPGSEQPGRGRPDATVPDPAQRQPVFPDMPRPIYLSGSVRLADGTSPPASVLIERVCNNVVRPEVWTNSKGDFSFFVGEQNGAVFADASIGGNDPLFQDPRSGASDAQRGVNPRDLAGCEIRANLAGFLSDSIMLTFRGAMDDSDIGIIHLHKLGNVEGYTFSISTALAPKDARNAYEKGLDNVRKRKWADAEKEFVKAVGNYPGYAIAWYELGRVYHQQKKLDDAHRAHSEAIKSDPKFISPYGQLAVLAVIQQKWDDVVMYTSQVLKLNPFVAPEIYFYSAVANYNLENVDVAEKHAREAARLDTQQQIPRINHLLGVILAQQEDYKEAAENLRTYLKLSPNAPDSAAIKQMLADIENAAP
jgi:tetratricopeptide (TPR) repeat protein